MEHLDEHEMLIQYSEMTGFDFNSEEFKKVRKDYLECKNFLINLTYSLSRLFNRQKITSDY